MNIWSRLTGGTAGDSGIAASEDPDLDKLAAAESLKNMPLRMLVETY